MQLRTQDAARHVTGELRERFRQLPSTMARLVFLSGLRDLNSGAYRAATASMAKDVDIDRVLRSMHEEAFSAWLNYRLAEQKADLDLYLSSVDCGKIRTARIWLHFESYRSLVPASASSTEKQLFVNDLHALLSIAVSSQSAIDVVDDGVESDCSEGCLLTTREVSRWLGVSPRTLRLWAETGEVPAIRVGRQWRFRRGVVREWLRQKTDH